MERCETLLLRAFMESGRKAIATENTERTEVSLVFSVYSVFSVVKDFSASMIG
jgi:hypothetical protein